MNKPICSIVMTARNDNYQGDFQYRLITALTLTIRELIRIGRADDVEVLIVDWGSEIPLYEVIPLDEDIRAHARFIVVPSKICDAHNGTSDYAVHTAINVGVRRAKGKYIIISGADIIFPATFFHKFFNLLENDSQQDMDHLLTGIPLKHVPLNIVKSGPDINWLEQYLTSSGTELPTQKIMPYLFGAAGAFVMSKDRWLELRGLDERLIYWGWGDIDLALRMRLKYDCLDTSLVDDRLFVYHLQHFDSSGKREYKPLCYFSNLIVNSTGWGLAGHAFMEFPVVNHPVAGSEPEFSSGNDIHYFMLTHFLNIIKFMAKNISDNEKFRDGWLALCLFVTYLRNQIKLKE